MILGYSSFYKGVFVRCCMVDEPPDDGDESGYRLPVTGLGKCMVPRNGEPSAGCLECVRTHYDEIARISEYGKDYYLNDCQCHDIMEDWRVIAGQLRGQINEMRIGEELGNYKTWVLRRMENLLSALDTAHTRKKPMDQPLDTLLANQQVETPV